MEKCVEGGEGRLRFEADAVDLVKDWHQYKNGSHRLISASYFSSCAEKPSIPLLQTILSLQLTNSPLLKSVFPLQRPFFF